MTSLATLAELPDVSYYNDWDSVKQALQNWSVRDKFTYKTPCKDDRRARYVCTQPNCFFRVTGNKDRGGRITVKVVNREHMCVQPSASDSNTTNNSTIGASAGSSAAVTESFDNATSGTSSNLKEAKYRNPATQMKWLVTAMKRVLDITPVTKPHDIQAAARQYYSEEISYQQAFRCLRLLTADIKEQGHRERVPDELRKAIVTLRVFVDPPMDWTEIERKTGIKARTAGYIFASAEKKSGGSKDPFVLLRNATISTSGPKASGKGIKSNGSDKIIVEHDNGGTDGAQASEIATGLTDSVSHSQNKRKLDEMIDPSLDVTFELARAAAEVEDTDQQPSDDAEAIDDVSDDDDLTSIQRSASKFLGPPDRVFSGDINGRAVVDSSLHTGHMANSFGVQL